MPVALDRLVSFLHNFLLNFWHNIQLLVYDSSVTGCSPEFVVLCIVVSVARVDLGSELIHLLVDFFFYVLLSNSFQELIAIVLLLLFWIVNVLSVITKMVDR